MREYHNGKRKDGYHIHHKDGDTHNNDISNLDSIMGTEHISNHTKRYHRENPEFARNNIMKSQEKCRIRHKSKE